MLNVTAPFDFSTVENLQSLSDTDIMLRVFSELRTNRPKASGSRGPASWRTNIGFSSLPNIVAKTELLPGVMHPLVGLPSTTDDMLRVFEELRTNRPKPLDSRRLASSLLNKGFSRSMPNMVVQQRTSDASTAEFLHVSTDPPFTATDSSTLQKESVELPASLPTAVVIVEDYESPAFCSCVGLVNEAVTTPVATERVEIGSVSSPTPEFRSAEEAEVSQASRDYGSLWPNSRESSMPVSAVQFGERVEAEDGTTKPPGEDETATGLLVPDIRISGCCTDAARMEPTTTGVVSPKRRRSLWNRTKRFVRLIFCCGAEKIARD